MHRAFRSWDKTRLVYSDPHRHVQGPRHHFTLHRSTLTTSRSASTERRRERQGPWTAHIHRGPRDPYQKLEAQKKGSSSSDALATTQTEAMLIVEARAKPAREEQRPHEIHFGARAWPDQCRACRPNRQCQRRPILMMRRTSVEVHDEFAVALRALQVHVWKRATDEAQDAPVLPERVAREDTDRPAARLIGQPVQHDATQAT